MTEQIISEVLLRYTQGTSDKFYKLRLEQTVDGKYMLTKSWGRWQKTVKHTVMTGELFGPLHEEFHKTYREKLKKGYVVEGILQEPFEKPVKPSSKKSPKAWADDTWDIL